MVESYGDSISMAPARGCWRLAHVQTSGGMATLVRSDQQADTQQLILDCVADNSCDVVGLLLVAVFALEELLAAVPANQQQQQQRSSTTNNNNHMHTAAYALELHVLLLSFFVELLITLLCLCGLVDVLAVVSKLLTAVAAWACHGLTTRTHTKTRQ